MNIAEAKQQIKNAMTAYFTKDKFGNYVIPVEKQRPIFLLGPPGVGKTAIMEQTASEMGVGLVSYSMTHHTRQSALGLPYIVDEEFEGYHYRMSEYTMSEIIGSVYRLMRETGVREGILFLDEINCVSETLAPSMLQFLQYKVFGQHRVPEGWIVVTAGNPPEYNKSVRDFDVVTWDRLKRIDVEPDFDTWKKYAAEKSLHPSVLTYLDARRADFYKIESSVDGKRFVTPRGWDDLAQMIRLYEEKDIPVDIKLISQYLQDPGIAGDFAIYYDLFRKYRSDYQIDRILSGEASESIIYRAERAAADERAALLGLLFDSLLHGIKNVCAHEDRLDALMPVLKRLKTQFAEDAGGAGEGFTELIAAEENDIRERLAKGRQASTLSTEKELVMQGCIAALQSYRAGIAEKKPADGDAAFAVIREIFNEDVAALRRESSLSVSQLDNVFAFCEKAFKDDDEILIFVTELTSDYYTARFIGHYGCYRYYMHSKKLAFDERKKDIAQKINEISWEV